MRATCIVIVPAPCWVPDVDVGQRGAQHAQIVDAAVLIEALVLGGEDRVLHDIRDFADRDDGAPLLAEFAEQDAVGGEDAQRDLRLVVGEGVEGGKGRPEQRQDEGPEQAADDGETRRRPRRYRVASALARWNKTHVWGGVRAPDYRRACNTGPPKKETI